MTIEITNTKGKEAQRQEHKRLPKDTKSSQLINMAKLYETFHQTHEMYIDQ